MITLINSHRCFGENGFDSILINYLVETYSKKGERWLNTSATGIDATDVFRERGIEFLGGSFEKSGEALKLGFSERFFDRVIIYPPRWSPKPLSKSRRIESDWSYWDYLGSLRDMIIASWRVLKNEGHLMLILEDYRRGEELYLAHAEVYRITVEYVLGARLRDFVVVDHLKSANEGEIRRVTQGEVALVFQKFEDL